MNGVAIRGFVWQDSLCPSHGEEVVFGYFSVWPGSCCCGICGPVCYCVVVFELLQVWCGSSVVTRIVAISAAALMCSCSFSVGAWVE